MKRAVWFLLICAFAVVALSCSVDPIEMFNKKSASFEYLKLESGKYFVSPNDEKVELKVELDDKNLSYQWYSCSSEKKDGAVAIDGAVESVYKADPVAVNEYAYYYCVVTKNGAIKVKRETPVYTVANTGLPSVYINTKDGVYIRDTKNWLKDAEFRIKSSEKDECVSEITSIKGRGNSSWDKDKKSYTIKFDSKKKILGMPKSKKWVLIANYSDKTLLRNYFASYLGQKVYNSTWNPRFKFVDFVLNGEYLGTYIIGEQIRIEDERINVQDISDVYTGEKKKDKNEDGKVDLFDGGFVFAIDKHDETECQLTTSRGYTFILKDPDVDNFVEGAETLVPEVYDHMLSIIQHAEDVVFSEDFADPVNGYSSVIDVDSFINWYLTNEFTKNCDAAWSCSVYFYYNPKDGKIYMGPSWDFDISCGNVNYNDAEFNEGFWIKDSGWHARLFEDKAFENKVKARWNETKASLDYAVRTVIDETADYIRPAAALNFKKWPVLGRFIWPSPGGWLYRKTYQSEIEYMKAWLITRYNWLDKQFN